jgi:hypothetical protein
VDRSLQQQEPSATVQPDQLTLSRGLAKIRQRRWILWGTIFIYLPGLYLALEAGLSGGTLAKLFWLWVALICVAVGLATVVKCPGCGKQFHTNGPTFLPVRKCLHCGLTLKADKQPVRQTDSTP